MRTVEVHSGGAQWRGTFKVHSRVVYWRCTVELHMGHFEQGLEAQFFLSFHLVYCIACSSSTKTCETIFVGNLKAK